MGRSHRSNDHRSSLIRPFGEGSTMKSRADAELAGARGTDRENVLYLARASCSPLSSSPPHTSYLYRPRSSTRRNTAPKPSLHSGYTTHTAQSAHQAVHHITDRQKRLLGSWCSRACLFLFETRIRKPRPSITSPQIVRPTTYHEVVVRVI